MTSTVIALALILPVILTGCDFTPVHMARESQMHWVAKGSGQEAELEVEPIDLRGKTLPELVDYAFTNRPSMTMAMLSVEDARLALKQIDSNAPILSTSPLGALSSSISVGRSERSNSGRHLDGDTHGSGSGALSLNVLVWDFGRHKAQAQSQAENVLAAELECIENGYEIFQEVVDAYFTLLKNKALLEVAFTNEYEFSEHLHQAEKRLEAGEAINLDVLKARLDLVQAKERVVSASNSVDVAGAYLMAALGVDASHGNYIKVLGEISGKLDEMPRVFADTGTSAKEYFDFACTNAPQMQVARTMLRAASAAVDYAIADTMPEINASLSLNWASPFWYWNWGVNVVQDIFTGFRKTTAIERARNTMDVAAYNVDQIGQNLSHNLEVAVAERDNARKALATAESSVISAKDNFDTVRERYLVGESSRVDFTSAVSDYATALGNRIEAFYRGQIAEAKLFALCGSKPEYIVENANGNKADE